MKNIKDIKIYTLEDCKYCNELKVQLKQYGLTYTEFNISNNDTLGNQIEYLFKCERYPMVILKEDILLLPESTLTTPNIHLYNSTPELINLEKKLK
jgi:glutaredoxin